MVLLSCILTASFSLQLHRARREIGKRGIAKTKQAKTTKQSWNVYVSTCFGGEKNQDIVSKLALQWIDKGLLF